jgi:hypothetical protein
MKQMVLLLATLSIAVPASAQPAQPPQLSLEHKMLLRCSAAFALVARWQEGGRPEVQQYPPLDERGKEFFVRASARVMDEAHLDREALEAALLTEARSLLPEGAVGAVMPACLSALEASER